MNTVLNELRMDSNRLMLSMLEDKLYARYDAFATGRTEKGRQLIPPGTPSKATKWIYGWPSGSLEMFHGAYHVAVGGCPFPPYIQGGHMSRVSVAAFDPVFVSFISSVALAND